MLDNIHEQRILIIDFGSQYTQLIARRVREAKVYCEIISYRCSEEDIKAFNPKGIILSGGPESVTQETTPRGCDFIFKYGCPVLGICYGMQTMVEQLGGQVSPAVQREFGHAKATIISPSLLFNNIEDAVAEDGQTILDVWMSHGDKVTALPHGFEVIAHSQNAPFAAIADTNRHFYGLQFHPEVTHTRQGKRVLEQFVYEICQCESRWTFTSIIEEIITETRAKVGNDHVLLGLSGGVDSAVVAALLHKAIGSQLTCIFVDTGLLRLNEADEVMSIFAKHMGVHVVCVDAKQRFYKVLEGITDPEQKRKLCGHLFIEIFQEQAALYNDAKWLAQGTIYPDVIESAASKLGHAHVIKTHHNVGGLPEDMHLSLIEPLRELFKDEVRNIGLKLGLPSALIQRHPFPGPGLAIRILGEVNVNNITLLQHADAIFIEELRAHGLYEKVSQAFAVFLPVKTVAIMGDTRAYEYVIGLRAVETVDFMTAQWAKLSYDFIGLVANRIVNEIKGISRVVYDVTSKPPATIEWE